MRTRPLCAVINSRLIAKAGNWHAPFWMHVCAAAKRRGVSLNDEVEMERLVRLEQVMQRTGMRQLIEKAKL